jgi:hypothetical protein
MRIQPDNSSVIRSTDVSPSPMPKRSLTDRGRRRQTVTAMWGRLRFLAVGLLVLPVLGSAGASAAAPTPAAGAFPMMSLSLAEISQQQSSLGSITVAIPASSPSPAPTRVAAPTAPTAPASSRLLAAPVAAPQPAGPAVPATCQAPAAPTNLQLDPTAHGSTTWAYRVVAYNACGDSASSAVATITNGPDRLDASTWTVGGPLIWVNWAPVAGLSCDATATHPAIEPCPNGYKVIRTISGPTPPEPTPCPSGTLVHVHPAFSSYKWGDNGAGCGLGVYH